MWTRSSLIDTLFASSPSSHCSAYYINGSGHQTERTVVCWISLCFYLALLDKSNASRFPLPRMEAHERSIVPEGVGLWCTLAYTHRARTTCLSPTVDRQWMELNV